MLMMKRYLWTEFRKIFLTYVFLLFFAIFGLILVCSFPSSKLKVNIANSLDTLKKEWIYPTYGLPFRKIILDNFTDSLMLNLSYSVDSGQPLRSAMINVYHDGKIDKDNQILNLEKVYLKKEVKPVFYYRYWHGYLLYLRPLLIFFSYSQIRVILTIILYFFLFIFLYLTWKRLGKKITFIFFASFLAVDYFYLGNSIHFSKVFFISLIGGIYFLLKSKAWQKGQSVLSLFFLIGALTSYFDLLSAPLIGLEILLILSVIVNKKWQSVFYIIFHSIFWGLGYGLFWLTKWIITDIFFVKGAFLAAYQQVLYRSTYQVDKNFSYLNTLKLNLFQLIGYDKSNKIIVFTIFLISILIFIFFNKINKKTIKEIIPFVLMGLIPYGWYMISASHAYLHVWFTYRNQLITVFSLVMIYLKLIDWKKIKSYLNK
jgi:hypothetical protein